MRRALTIALFILALPGLGAVVSGCGDEHELDVPEGEPLELGELTYNVQITRYLNPFASEDSTYLQGAPEPGEDQQYLGVFMQITNHGDSEATVPGFTIRDTRGTTYEQVPLAKENAFALQPGTTIAPGKRVPGVETAAGNGPVEGALTLFIIDSAANENRPLKLEVPGDGETGEVELDI